MARLKNFANDYISNPPKLLSPGKRFVLTLGMGSAKTEIRYLEQLTEHKYKAKRDS
jgi:hypothetical protein